MSGTVAAVDLGATSGRVVVGNVDRDDLRLHVTSRFDNAPVRTPDGLHWSILELYRDAVEGLATAVRIAPGLASIGIDSWAVDYALLRDGRMLATPYSYRDERTSAAVERLEARADASAIYLANGLQHLPFSTLFQLEADRFSGMLELADRALLLPDLLGFWLTGAEVAERTNASTTGLVDITHGEWSPELLELVGAQGGLFPPLVEAGTTLGRLLPTAARGIGSTDTVVTAVGSHDTASAVVAVPSTSPDVAFISCGTWSLVGVELERPVLTEESRLAGFTNEGGVDGRIRYLHNVMGLWLLSESIRDWERTGERIDLDRLLAEAAVVTGRVPVFDADDPVFLAPGDMPARIAAWLSERGESVPASRAELTRSILESLAAAYARTIDAARRLSGVDVRVIHLVGGGSRNELLCRLTAGATGLPVFAGPDEATAIGNILVQARSLGWVSGSLESLRDLVICTFPPRRHLPEAGASGTGGARSSLPRVSSRTSRRRR